MGHLQDAHRILRKDGTFQQYISTYFQAPLCSCGCGEKVQLAKRDFKFAKFATGCPGLHRSRNPSCVDFYLHQGMDVDEAIEAFRLRQAIVAKRHSTEELRDKLSELNSGANNPASVSSIMKRTGKKRKDVHADLSAKSSGINNGFYGKTHNDTVLIENAKRQSRGSKFVTKPEMAIWGMLQALGYEFYYEEPIDRYIVDFLVGDIVIEVFGDFWHNNIKMKFMRKQEKDAIKMNKLRELGYKVEIIWESEIFKDPQSVVRRLKELFCENKID